MLTINCPLHAAFERTPAAPALLDEHGGCDFAGLEQEVRRMQAGLTRAGVAPGQTVALQLAPGPAVPALLHACWRMGLIAFPVNPRFPKQYLREVLTSACADILIAEEAFSTPDNLPVLTPEALRGDPVKEAPGATPRITLDTPATLVLTSGSTGQPKAALHSYGNHIHNARHANHNMPLEAGDIWLLSLPVHHVAGLGVLFRCAIAGATLAIPKQDAAFGDTLERLAPTHVSLVAAQLQRLMARSEDVARLRGMKAVLLGGGPAPERLLAQAHAAGIPLHTTYGLTEMASQVTTTRPGADLEELLSAGRPLIPRTVRISPAGEVLVGGETRFLGYRELGGFLRPFDEEGFFHTGDLGHFDPAGRLHITGRRDNMFVCGGENIQPEEIELALCALPGVAEALVVPVEDEGFGRIPVAFVRGRGVEEPGELELALSRSLPRFKVPRHFLAWPEVWPPDQKPRRREFARLASEHLRTTTAVHR